MHRDHPTAAGGSSQAPAQENSSVRSESPALRWRNWSSAPQRVSGRTRPGRPSAEFLLPLEIAAFDETAATAYGVVRATLERKGKPIGPLDTLIAAHALALGAVARYE